MSSSPINISSASSTRTQKLCPICSRGALTTRPRSRGRLLVKSRTNPKRSASMSSSLMSGPGIRVPLSRESKIVALCKIDEIKDVDEGAECCYVHRDKEDDDVTFSLTSRRSSKKRRYRNGYRCDACPRVFHSPQGLGRHRVVHRKTPTRGVFRCSRCHRVFGSDHRTSPETDKNVAARLNHARFDLNLRPSLEDNFPLDLNNLPA